MTNDQNLIEPIAEMEQKIKAGEVLLRDAQGSPD